MSIFCTAVLLFAGWLYGRHLGLKAKKEQDAFDRKIRGQSPTS